MLTLQAKEKEIENLTPEEEFVRGTVGTECQIDLDEFWQGYENTVVFKRENDCTVYNVAIDSLSNRVEIPYPILAESGSFKVGLFGVKPDEVLPTLWSDYIKVRYGTDTHGTTPPKYEPNEIDQLRLSKQDSLVSGTNIKTINNQSILGSGNITIEGGSGSSITVDQTYNPESENAQSGKAVAEAVAQSGGGTVGDWEQLIDVTTQEDASSFSFTFKDVKELIVMISGIATKPRVNFYSNGMTNFFHYYFLGADKFASNYMYIRRRLGGMRYVESGNASSGQPDLISSYELVSDATSCGKLVSSTNDMVNDLRFGLNSQEVLKSGARIQIFGR